MTSMLTSVGPVVVGFDGTSASYEALRWAAHEATALHTNLHVLHIQPPLPAETAGYPLVTAAPDDDDQPGQSLLEEARRLIAETEPGLTVTTTLVHEAVPPALLDASSSGASILVIGSRGRGGISGLFFGSTSTHVSSHAACPVIVLHDPAEHAYIGEPTEFAGRVVLGLDGSELSLEAMNFAFDYACRHGLGLTAVHTWNVPIPETVPPIIMSSDELDDVQDDELKITARQLAAFAQAHPDVDLRQKVIRGSAEAVLVAAAQDCALVVVGSRGRGGLLGLVLGSVSQALLRHAVSPVAVVRPQD